MCILSIKVPLWKSLETYLMILELSWWHFCEVFPTFQYSTIFSWWFLKEFAQAASEVEIVEICSNEYFFHFSHVHILCNIITFIHKQTNKQKIMHSLTFFKCGRYYLYYAWFWLYSRSAERDNKKFWWICIAGIYIQEIKWFGLFV